MTKRVVTTDKSEERKVNLEFALKAGIENHVTDCHFKLPRRLLGAAIIVSYSSLLQP